MLAEGVIEHDRKKCIKAEELTIQCLGDLSINSEYRLVWGEEVSQALQKNPGIVAGVSLTLAGGIPYKVVTVLENDIEELKSYLRKSRIDYYEDEP